MPSEPSDTAAVAGAGSGMSSVRESHYRRQSLREVPIAISAPHVGCRLLLQQRKSEAPAGSTVRAIN
jgi:hypothetical protein